jgi:hypothetical protein
MHSVPLLNKPQHKKEGNHSTVTSSFIFEGSFNCACSIHAVLVKGVRIGGWLNFSQKIRNIEIDPWTR